jgi:hypothetical protein
MPSLLAHGECRRGHMIRSEGDLVGPDLHRRCRQCRRDDARLSRIHQAVRAYVDRNAASARYQAQWAVWVKAGAEGPMPRLPAILR